MIIVTVDHHVRDGMIEAARERIGTNSAKMTQSKGMISRKTGIASGFPNRIVTVTEWESREDMAAWEQVKKSIPVSLDPSAIFIEIQKAEIEVYETIP